MYSPEFFVVFHGQAASKQQEIYLLWDTMSETGWLQIRVYESYFQSN